MEGCMKKIKNTKINFKLIAFALVIMIIVSIFLIETGENGSFIIDILLILLLIFSITLIIIKKNVKKDSWVFLLVLIFLIIVIIQLLINL